jgi:hypothetical protein
MYGPTFLVLLALVAHYGMFGATQDVIVDQ